MQIGHGEVKCVAFFQQNLHKLLFKHFGIRNRRFAVHNVLLYIILSIGFAIRVVIHFRLNFLIPIQPLNRFRPFAVFACPDYSVRL